MEHKGATKFADFENFAKTFALSTYQDLMGATQANKASLAGAARLKGSMLDAGGFEARRPPFGGFLPFSRRCRMTTQSWAWRFLRPSSASTRALRLTLADIAEYVSNKTKRTRLDESAAANLVAETLRVDRL